MAYPKVILTEGGGDRFIVATSLEQGYLIDIYQGVKSPTMSLMALTTGGYWQDYQGKMTPADLEKRYKKNKR